MNEINYDEARVPQYTLPPLLTLGDGRPITDRETWCRLRRPELLALFGQHMYGTTPTASRLLTVSRRPLSCTGLQGRARVQEIIVRFAEDDSEPQMCILLFLPVSSSAPSPIFLGLNFEGNHTVHPDPAISRPRWPAPQHRAAERGSQQRRWPVERLLARGYGLATIYAGDIAPDVAPELAPELAPDGGDSFGHTVQSLFFEPGQTRPRPDQWGVIGAWAWGLSRALDALQRDPAVSAGQVALLGHSRMGKAALWAAAQDERFALVISNESGCGGVALSRRRFGETVAAINERFPHWFCRNFHRYNEAEDDLPLDQHMLLALIAPRPLYVASAADDLWADPYGEFLSLLHALPAYELWGEVGFPRQQPPLATPVRGRLGYHIRSGEHEITDFDWGCYLDFADLHLG